MLTTTSAGSASSGSRSSRPACGGWPRRLFVGLEAEPVVLGVGARPHAGDGRQVVGGHRGQRLLRELGRAVRLEPQQPVGEDAALGQAPGARSPRPCRGPPPRCRRRPGGSPGPGCRASRRGGSGRRRPRPLSAPAGIQNRRNRPMTWSTRDAARRPEAGPDGADPGVVAGRPQPPGVERGEAPVLPLAVEVVGRGADPHAERHRVLPQPGVGAAGIDADGQVLHQVDARRRPAPAGAR